MEMTQRQINDRVRELWQEYQDIQLRMRKAMLPLREGNPLSVRLDEIRRELWTYGVDWRKF